MRGMRDKIAQRRAQLEVQRSVLEQQTQQLEKQELELSQNGQVRYNVDGLTTPRSPMSSPMARCRTLGSQNLDDSTFSMGKVSAAPTAGTDTPRRASTATDTLVYAELRSWVRRKTDGLRKEGGLSSLANVCAGLASDESLSPDNERERSKTTSYPSHSLNRVGSDYMKFSSKHSSKFAGDDIDSTMSSVTSDMSKDSRCEMRGQPSDMPVPRSRQRSGRIGCAIPPE